MTTGHPRWFHPSSFSRAVLNFSLRKIGWLAPEEQINLDIEDQEFSEAVQIVGNAVFTLQLMFRHRLRPLFIESITLVADVVDGHNHEIFRFMIQTYLEKDIFNFILSDFAIIAELIIFLDDFGIPISNHSYHIPWCHIYSHRVKDVLAYRGGFRELLKVARRRYTESGLYNETLISFVNNTPIRHAEVRGLDNWPENPLQFLHDTFEEIPSSSDLAMDILRKLYAHKEGLIPLPEEQMLWL